MFTISFFRAVVQAGTPLLFATLGEILTEKSGNLNLGVEGLMLIGAVSGFSAGLATGNPVLAILIAMFAGMMAGLLFAFMTVTLRTNQVVTGLSLTILGTGISGFVGQSLIGEVMPDNFKVFFSDVSIPLLSKIPFVGPVLFTQNVFVFLGLISAILMGLYFYFTKFGLHLRTIGENPYAADASGISVNKYKYVHIMIGSGLSALGGAYLSMVYVPAWQENITAGRGWIAVALVIFSMWSPYRAILGAFLFGGLDIIGFRIQQMDLAVSQYVLDMLPYAVTILVLIINSMGKHRDSAPSALSVPFFREER